MSHSNITIPGPLGTLEAILQQPQQGEAKPIVAVICHPHPLHQGTMLNKVVTTIARTFDILGITTVRFNYRGVGSSEGAYGNISGEVDDCRSVVAYALQKFPGYQLWLAGFSFGCYISAKVATETDCQQLVSIAPSVDNMPFAELSLPGCPWLVVQGTDDEVVSAEATFKWAAGLNDVVTLVKMDNVGHFFHGKLIELRELLLDRLSSH